MSRKIAEVPVTLERAYISNGDLVLRVVEEKREGENYPVSHELRVPVGDSVAVCVGEKHRLVLLQGDD